MTQKQDKTSEDNAVTGKSEITHEAIATEETKADMNTVTGGASTEEWKVKAEEYLEDLKRTRAEFENYKKRQALQQKELGGYLIDKLVLDIIPVLDNFRQATLHVPIKEKESPWVTGIQYIEKQLETVLMDNGVEAIEVKVGDTFDPSMHEAIAQTTDTEHHTEQEQGEKTAFKKKDQPNVITQVLHKGYKFGSRVVRPARVIVG